MRYRANAFRWFLLAPLLIGSSPSSAAGSYVGLVEEVWVNGESAEDIGWIKPAGAVTSSACTSGAWFALDLTKPSMRQALSFALAALASGRQVRLIGSGACYGSYEYLRVVAVK